MFQLIGKINRLKPILQKINKERFSDLEAQVEQTKEKLLNCQAQIQQNPRDKDLIAEEGKLANECIIKQQARHQYLQQKSKINWILEGDQNTKFYHNIIIARRNVNRIFTIKVKRNEYLTDIQGINEAFLEYYNVLLGTRNEERIHANSEIVKRGPLITEEQRVLLITPFTDKDVKKAL